MRKDHSEKEKHSKENGAEGPTSPHIARDGIIRVIQGVTRTHRRTGPINGDVRKGKVVIKDGAKLGKENLIGEVAINQKSKIRTNIEIRQIVNIYGDSLITRGRFKIIVHKFRLEKEIPSQAVRRS